MEVSYCTFGLCGESLVHQAIYICRTCTIEGNQCCCSSCASSCHNSHDVDFLAFGKAYWYE